jgi:transcriptional regulator with XRE-family HTH domain
MADRQKAGFFETRLEDLLTTPAQQRAFVEASAALEAGLVVRMLRERVKLSQAELAHLLGVSQPRISAIESGAGRDGPSYALLKRIAAACGMSLNLTRLLSETSSKSLETDAAAAAMAAPAPAAPQPPRRAAVGARAAAKAYGD